MSILHLDMILSPLMTQPSGKGVYPHWKFPEQNQEQNAQENTFAVILTILSRNSILRGSKTTTKVGISHRSCHHYRARYGIEERRMNV